MSHHKSWQWKLARTALSALGFFFLMLAYYVVKPVREPLFFKHFGKEYLHYFYMSTSVITLVALIGYNYLLTRFPRVQLLRIIFLGVAVILAIFGGFLYQGEDSAIFATLLFFFITLFIVFLTTLFWSFNHDIHTSQEAETFYPYILLGAQLGVYLSYEVIYGRLKKIEDSTLLFIGSGGFILTWLLLEGLKKFDVNLEKNKYVKPKTMGAIKDFSLFFSNRYVLFIGLLVLFASFTATVSDQQFKWLLDDTVFKGKEFEKFNENDITNQQKLIQNLKDPSMAFSTYIMQKISPSIRQKINNYNDKAENKNLKKQLIDEFNTIIQKENIYKKEYFAAKAKTKRESKKTNKAKVESKKTELSQRTINLIAQNPQEDDRTLLNKLLLEEVYKDSLASSQQKQQRNLLGKIYGYSGLGNIIMCLVIVPFLLWLLGPAKMLCFYPLALFIGGILFLQHASIYMISYFVIAAYSLNYTLYNAGKEIFYVPTDKEVKYRMKALCDTFLFRFGDMGSAFLVFLYIDVFAVATTLTNLSYVVFMVVMIWLIIIVQTGVKYKGLVQEQETKNE